MPWTTPTLKDVRGMVRDSVRAALSPVVLVPNSVMRVMSDAMAALAHLTLLYLDWLALQLMPDTSETVWLDRHAEIWLVNSDGSVGRKVATFSFGTILCTGQDEAIVPNGSQLQSITGVMFEVTQQTTIGTTVTPVPVRALDAGRQGNLAPEDVLSFAPPVTNVDSTAAVEQVGGGTDQETDDELRARVLQRIQQPPMGGDAEDYVHWTLMVPGVTRAWAYPLEMGIGTVTVRFMCDDLRAVENDGFPLDEDVQAVTQFLNQMRPVTVKDFFVVAPLRFPINFKIINLDSDDAATRANIESSVETMFMLRAIPGQEIYRSWISEAISEAAGVAHFDLQYENTEMPSNGYMPIVGTISYG